MLSSKTSSSRRTSTGITVIGLFFSKFLLICSAESHTKAVFIKLTSCTLFLNSHI